VDIEEGGTLNILATGTLKRIGGALAVVAAGLALSTPEVRADTVHTYDFGTQIAGAGPVNPGATFATLTASTPDYLHYVLDLRVAPGFGTLFGDANAFISRVLFNTGGIDPAPHSVNLMPGSWGVSTVAYGTGDSTLGGVVFAFTDVLGSLANSANQLTSGERVVWTTSFLAPTIFLEPPFAVKVHTGDNGSVYGWYVPTAAIPEPQMYAMLVAGLGLMGFVIRHRQRASEA
jgi:hypothetical protein